MTSLAIVYAVLVAATIVFVATSWALAHLVGARVTAIGLGAPGVALRRREPAIRVGPIPGGSVELHGRADEQDDGDPRSWKRLGLSRRLLILLGPWVATLAIAALCVGPARTLRSFVRGLGQLLLTLDLTPLVRQLLDAVAIAPIATTVGIVLAKLSAANTPMLVGSALQELTGMSRWTRTLQVVMVLVVML
jgi:hypothetical protein